MAESAIIEIVRKYLSALPGYGIHAKRAVLYGSYARGDSREWSDIDLLVIAPEFDETRSVDVVKRLWRATGAADNRIEPVPCGEKEWVENDSCTIIEMARREGIMIAA
ncbi:MAG: nucleotidyltransferase domain-containing protein [Candidatus Sumerlaeota bacterium]|nr:nucleotidyltransferase domain-containing protein [Candidatus Sumerlaeota bacterium]